MGDAEDGAVEGGTRTREVPRLTDGEVVLRLVTDADAPAMTEGLAEWATAMWMPSVPHPSPHSESLDWIRGVAPKGWETGSACWWAVADTWDDAFLGEVGIRRSEARSRFGELGCWVVPAARGREAAPRGGAAGASVCRGSRWDGMARLPQAALAARQPRGD